MSRIAITGLGAVSGLGVGVAALWQGLGAAVQAPRRYPALGGVELDIGPVAKVLLPQEQALLCGADDDGRALLTGWPRAGMMAQLAADEALRDAGLDPAAGGALGLGLTVGTTLGEKAPWVQQLRALCGVAAAPGGDSFGVAAPARALARRYGARHLQVTSTACASGNVALGMALNWLRGGLCELVLCGGVDSISEFVLSGFHSLRAHSKAPCQPFDRARSGLNLGEGAAFLVLESEEHARRRGQRIRAYLSGYGLACDANHMTGPDRQGRGAARAMSAALADAGLDAAAVDFVSAHGTATAFNDAMEARALTLVLGERGPTVPVNSIKGSLGHTLGAAGALEAVMAVRALEEQVVPPTAGCGERDPELVLNIVAGAAQAAPLSVVLSTSSGFGGVNAALVLGRAEATGTAPLAAAGVIPRRAAVPLAVVAAGALFPRPDEPLGPQLPPSAPPALAGQLTRMDRLCALAACVAERALVGQWQLRQAPPWPAEKLAVLVGSFYGCHKTDEEYYRTVLARQPSPRLFAYTLPSSPVGELSILHGLRGPGLAVVGARSAGLAALAEASALLHSGQADACLVVAVEVAAPAVRETWAEPDEQPADAAVALLLTRADSPLLAGPAALGYIAGVTTAYQADAPTAALQRAAAGTLQAAADPRRAAAAVLSDELTRRYLPPELQAAAVPPAVASGQHGSAAALQAVLAAAAGELGGALVLCCDADGQAAAALWSRSLS